MKYTPYILSLAVLFPALPLSAVEYPGTNPGKAQAHISPSTDGGCDFTLSNQLFSAEFRQSPTGGVTFQGMKAKDGTPLLDAGGGAVFTINLAYGQQLTSSDMVLTSAPEVKNLEANRDSLRIADQCEGKAISATFAAPDGSFSVVWKAILRDGSHYIRQTLEISTAKPVSFATITPLDVRTAEPEGIPTISGNTTHGTVAVTKKLFLGLETPMSVMTVGNAPNDSEDAWSPESWTPGMFGHVFAVPESFQAVYGDIYNARKGPVVQHLRMAEGNIMFTEGGTCHIHFKYEKGNHRLNIVGVQLVTPAGQVISEDIHTGYAGTSTANNTYSISVPEKGTYHLRYWVETKTETITSSGRIGLSLGLGYAQEDVQVLPENLVRGTWVRKTTLQPNETWEVSSVIGLFAPQQERRSVLCYLEREKPVPYRIFAHYNDWYEVGIIRHDNQDPLKRTTEKISLDIIRHWEQEMFRKRGVTMDGFIIDDGWDDFNSLWDFHAGFPQGFSELNKVAVGMNAGIGTWLGPVGGYGSSKRQRIQYWNRTHPNNQISSFELSNPEYFEAFLDRCRYMIQQYDMRYFKFDGISTKFHAKGPGGLEDAEGILRVLKTLRKSRPDIFINTSVGTWASPFWLLHADSVWRQEDDFGMVGNMGDPRDKWITYRDRLVHEVFVTGAPLMPINSIMTHGTMITKNGPPQVMSKAPVNCVKEMRAAFTSGSGLQEIYVDSDLMDQQDGLLWDELANCISWIRRNADVLANVHWVGGNPWDGKDGDIYGWASWNREKCTLSLRNSSAHSKTMQTSLRKLLDIPPSIKGAIRLRSSFQDQRILSVMNKELDVDQEITITLHPFEVIAMEGVSL